MKKVIVGLSGGVDSSVAAYLLQQQGYDVTGIFMKNWHDKTVTISDECPWLEDSKDARMVAEKLGIPFEVVDLSKQYKEKIVDYMFKEYQIGHTPNPDVLCNREIKFAVFMDIALGMGADYVATGHYSRRGILQKEGKSIYQLLAGKDGNKDQSYFLCQLSQEQLSKSLFPIGELTKPEVRKIALDLDLVTAEKKDSQGLCFIGKVRLPDFLQAYLKPKEGVIVQVDKAAEILFPTQKAFDSKETELAFLSKRPDFTTSDGKIVGKHQGAHYFTIGQRKGLAVGGTKEALYVIGTDVIANIIYAGEGKNHPGLYSKALFITKEVVHWVREDLEIAVGETLEVSARIRYRQPLQEALLYRFESGVYIAFKSPQSAVTKGQFATWYIADELIGSGVIH